MRLPMKPRVSSMRRVGCGVVAGAAVAMLTACVPRSRMCTASSECSAQSVCVAGRCQLEKASVKPAIDTARRLVVRPVDIAYVKTGDGPARGALPDVFVLGKDGAKLFLRFEVPVLPSANIVEAYVVLHRSSLVDDDPEPTVLHATRIVESWSGRSTSWALQPRTTETRLPSTTVEPGGSPLVRLDVRDVVRQWARRDPNDHGLAIVAENETKTGTTFALSEVGTARETTETGLGGRSAPPPTTVEPYLEIYVR